MSARDNAQNHPDWLASWLLNVAALDGREVTVMIGVARTPDGPMVAFQVGDDTPVVLSMNDTAPLLIHTFRNAISERIRMSNRGEG